MARSGPQRGAQKAASHAQGRRRRVVQLDPGIGLALLVDVGREVAAEYLVDHDRSANVPLPKEEWELTTDPANCRQCNFYELCKPELEEQI